MKKFFGNWAIDHISSSYRYNVPEEESFRGNNATEEDSLENLRNDFSITELYGFTVLLAYYSYEDYSGSAFVLLEKDGRLYEVNGSHCSCYGLEGQFKTEETSPDAIRYRIYSGNLGKDCEYNYDTDEYNDCTSIFSDELLQAVEEFEVRNAS